MHFTTKYLAIIILSALFVSCASHKTGKDGMIKALRYENPGKTLHYKSNTGFQQKMEIRGNKVDIEFVSNIEFSMAPEPGDGELTYNVTINKYEAHYKTPQGESDVDSKDAEGKSFELKMFANGKEISYGKLDDIKIVTPNGKQSISADFKAMFPDIPAIVKAEGQSWVTKDTIIEKDDKKDVTLIINLNNTFVGYENFQGRKCMKVRTDGDIIMETLTSEQGQELKITGKFTGNGVYYFDTDNGIYVGEEFKANGTGNINIPAQKMDIPYTRTFDKNVFLVE